MRLARLVFPPPKLKSKKVEAGTPQSPVGVERNNLRFVCGQFQVEFPQALTQHFIEALSILFFLEGTDEVVCVPNETGFAPTVWNNHFLKPLIECEVQIDIR